MTVDDLRASGDSSTTRSDRLRADQVQCWRRGIPKLVEDYLREDPELATDVEALLDLIYSEVVLREEAGERPTVDQFVARFPQLEEPIRRQFAIHAALPPDDDDVSSAAPQFADYDLLEEVGRGAMGIVYKARHRKLKRIVALKVMRHRSPADDSLLARFRAEAEAVARLQHPNIVQIYDCGEIDGCAFLSLEFVAGGNLEAWTRAPLHSIAECVALVEQVARAVGFAHEHQIVHRDLKPANILIGSVPKVTDFGLAKQINDQTNLTHTSAILGTGTYMSPEQAWGRSREVGPASDVHALGIILYELLTGETPYRSDSLMQTLDRVRFEEPIPPSKWRSEIPAELEAICVRCLAKTPADRYSTGTELADELQRFSRGEPLQQVKAVRTKRPRKPLVVASLCAAVFFVSLAGWYVGSAFVNRGLQPSTNHGSHNTLSADPSGVSTSGSATGPPNSTAPRTTPIAFAFLVGVRSYQFGDQRVDLEYTEADVDALSRLLLRRGYARQNIRLLTQWSEADNPSLAPTGANIRRQLPELLADCQPIDSVLIAITGMGGDAGQNSTYCYLPADARLDQFESLMPLNEWFEMLSRCRAQRKLLLIDTCQSAALRDFELPEVKVPAHSAALFACSSQEASYEHAKLRHGVFSNYVLSGLEGSADTNRDGRVSLGELFDFTRSHVTTFVRDEFPGAVQTPRLLGTLEPDTPILLTR